MLCKGLHHAAYRCADAKETVDFYTTVLGLKFFHATGADRVPSTNAYSPHIHIFLQMEDGSCIAFFELTNEKGTVSGRDPETPVWVQHFAFRVKDMESLLRAKANLTEKGIDVLGPVNHENFVHSIYFFDPSGHRLELCVQSATPEMLREFEHSAADILNRWTEHHSWEVGK